MKDKDINDWREEIDELDHEIQRLFEKRMLISAGIAAYKKQNGLPVYDEEREKEKIRSLKASASGDFMAEGIARLYETLMAISRDYQEERIERD